FLLTIKSPGSAKSVSEFMIKEQRAEKKRQIKLFEQVKKDHEYFRKKERQLKNEYERIRNEKIKTLQLLNKFNRKFRKKERQLEDEYERVKFEKIRTQQLLDEFNRKFRKNRNRLKPSQYL